MTSGYLEAGAHGERVDRVRHRKQRLHATDGPVGKVRGLAVLTRGRRVTHVLLDEGHLWGKRRVAIPIGAVADFSDGVRLSLTRDEVRDLPPDDLPPAED